MIMKIKLLFVPLAGLILVGCTTPYQPQEYTLRAGLIPTVKVLGDVKIKNAQPSRETAIVYSYMGSKLSSNYNAITQVMVGQVQRELKKNGSFTPSSADKSISIRVDYLRSKYRAMYWVSKLSYTATLGNGQTLNKQVRHRSGLLYQDLNGCIADASLSLFRDENVINYLKQ